MGFWKTITIEGKPKFWDKPNCRWKLSPLEDEALIDFSATQADYDEVNADPDTIELTRNQAESLSKDWNDPAWIYPTSSELFCIGYCSVADLRDKGITPEMATDEDLRKSIQIATQIIDSFCNRNFWRREEKYFLDGDGTSVLFLEDRPVIKISRLKIDGRELAPSEYKLYGEPGYIKLIGLNPIAGKNIKGLFPRGEQNIEVYGQFGFTTIPSEVRQSCILLSTDTLREMKSEIDLTKSTSSSTRNAIGLKRAKIEDISVEFEYPYSSTHGKEGRITTGNSDVDYMLLKFKKDMEATVV